MDNFLRHTLGHIFFVSSLLAASVVGFSAKAENAPDVETQTIDSLTTTSINSSQPLSDDDCDPTFEDCTAIGEWSFGVAVGLGLRSNPIRDGDDIPLIFLPSFSYYGERFFIDNLDVGYTIADSSNWMLNLLATPSYDRVFFERWDIGNFFIDFSGSSPTAAEPPPNLGSGFEDNEQVTDLIADELKDRDFTLLGGLEFSVDLFGGQFQASYLQDLNNVHSGQEARLAFSSPVSSNGWQGTLGLTWKSKELTDYYYGLDPEEVVDDRALYQAGSSINPFLRINWQQQGNQESYWRLGLEYQKLDAEISDSPLVDKDYVLTFFVGKQFNF